LLVGVEEDKELLAAEAAVVIENHQAIQAVTQQVL
jgi:hypothetical protein